MVCSHVARSRRSRRTSASLGLPEGFIRGLNATNPDTNAWARLERSEVDLDGVRRAVFAAEPRRSGHHVERREVLALPRRRAAAEMVEAARARAGTAA